MTTLSKDEINQALAGLPGWELDGEAITREFKFSNFVEAVAFVDRLVEPAEAANHHPDLEIHYNRVRVALSTHSEGGITNKDFALAREIDALAPG
jgi:4a-hydroxytetrahydrobiopterin dehydratase